MAILRLLAAAELIEADFGSNTTNSEESKTPKFPEEQGTAYTAAIRSSMGTAAIHSRQHRR